MHLMYWALLHGWCKTSKDGKKAKRISPHIIREEDISKAQGTQIISRKRAKNGFHSPHLLHTPPLSTLRSNIGRSARGGWERERERATKLAKGLFGQKVVTGCSLENKTVSAWREMHPRKRWDERNKKTLWALPPRTLT
jgi:hypothetical protein